MRQFFQHNIAITTNLTMESIQKPCLLSNYSMKDGMEYVTHFMEGQQSLLDEVYVLVAQTSSTTCWSRQQQCNNECFLCCRCIFLMILNSYCAHESSIVNSECDG